MNPLDDWDDAKTTLQRLTFYAYAKVEIIAATAPDAPKIAELCENIKHALRMDTLPGMVELQITNVSLSDIEAFQVDEEPLVA